MWGLNERTAPGPLPGVSFLSLSWQWNHTGLQMILQDPMIDQLLGLDEGFPTLARLTFGSGGSLLWGAVLGTAGCRAAALVSTH